MTEGFIEAPAEPVDFVRRIARHTERPADRRARRLPCLTVEETLPRITVAEAGGDVDVAPADGGAQPID